MYRTCCCILLASLALVACQHSATSITAVPTTATESRVTLLPLSGPAAVREAEFSGLDWFGDTLILLPQYPARVGNAVYGLPRDEILAALDALAAGHEAAPLQPRAIPLQLPDTRQLPGYQGLEAIAFRGAQAFVSIETTASGITGSYLLRGRIAADLSRLTLAAAPMARVDGRSGVGNYAEESLLWHHDELLSLHEANGRNVNASPQVQRFDPQLGQHSAAAFPTLEYRVTDASRADESGRFWVINSLYRGSLAKLKPAADALRTAFGTAPSQRAGDTIERLLELHYDGQQIRLSPRAPLQLALAEDGRARNWEGLARLPERDGFLLITDKFPSTLLGFVRQPTKP